MPVSEADRDPFFVGWFRMPATYSRYLIPIVGVLLLASGIFAFLIAYHQSTPGTGTWNESTTEFVGIAYAEPYALIRITDSSTSGQPVSVLLVNSGKHGATDRVLPYNGKPVRVTGTVLLRAGWRMLELGEDEDALAPANLPELEQARLLRTAPQDLGLVSLRGEIVDSKCFLGAMKPGTGRTHKGCGILCLKGGIPPLFVSDESSTGITLLTNHDGGPLDPLYFERAGETLNLNGNLQQWDDLRVLKVAHEPR